MAVTLEIIIDDLTIGSDKVAKVTAKIDAVLLATDGDTWERIFPTLMLTADIECAVVDDLFGEYIWTALPTITDNRV